MPDTIPDATPVLHLPYILPAQAQKHVTHNEAIRLLDVIVQLSVTARNLTSPPQSPAQGDRYIIAPNAAGDWAGHEGQIALWENGAWQFFTPNAGWTAWVMAEQVLASYSGSVWASQADGPFNVGRLGISATPDDTNRLAVSAQASLLNHAGAGHQLKINKALPADTASLLFQTGFSGRAEMGTAGDDDFAIKVSADGGAFVTGLSIAAASGEVTLPAAVRLGGQVSDPVSPVDGMIWLNTTSGEVKLRSGGATFALASGALGVADGVKGDVTVSAGGTQWDIGAGAVGNAKLADMPTGMFKARISAGTGSPEDVLPADAAQMLPVFSASAKGLAPSSGGGTAHFLRADGAWAAPPTAAAAALTDFGVTASAPAIDRIADIRPPPAGQFLVPDPDWNRAVSAADFSNAALWPSVATQNGITATKTIVTRPDGMPAAQYRFQGTATNSFTGGNIYASVLSRAVVSTGQVMSASCIARFVAGSLAGVQGLRVQVSEDDAAGVYIGDTKSDSFIASTDTVLTATRTQTTGTQMRPALQLGIVTGAVIDVTFEIAALQFEYGAARTIGRFAYVSSTAMRGLLGFSSGAVLQTIRAVEASRIATTATIPLDNTIPQSTEGLQILSATLVPAQSNSFIEIDLNIPMIGATNAAQVIAAVFANGSSNAIATGCVTVAANSQDGVRLVGRISSGGVAARTITARIGTSAGVSLYMNGTSTAAAFGGSAYASLILREVI